MMKQLLALIHKLNMDSKYARELARIRRNPAPGLRCLILKGPELEPATIVNARAYSYGATEVLVQGDRPEFYGWYTVDLLFPEMTHRPGTTLNRRLWERQA